MTQLPAAKSPPGKTALAETARAARKLLRLLSPDGCHLRQTPAGWRVFGPANDFSAPLAAADDALVARLLDIGVVLRRGGGEAVLAPAAGAPRRNDSESPLSRLYHRPGKDGHAIIDAAQFAAGERLRADYERSAMERRVTARWDLPTVRGSGGNHEAALSDTALAARQRFHAALDAVGPELSSILFQVCCLAAGLEQAERALALPARSGKAVLGLALIRLARHYGLAEAPRRHGTISHWAMAGSRPVVITGKR